MEVLGIDIGGSGIKGAVVDTDNGQLISERIRLPTPKRSTPERIAETLAELVDAFSWRRRVGCGFPGVVRAGQVLTAANVSSEWVDIQADELMKQITGRDFVFANDADLAGLAEARFGAGRTHRGFVLMLTIGTGVGSAFLYDQRLIPNTELGHLMVDGHMLDDWASARARQKDHLSWKKWARRLDRTLNVVHDFLWPELIILGGGASKKHEKFFRFLEPPCRTVPAELRNDAGIIGAALAVSQRLRV